MLELKALSEHSLAPPDLCDDKENGVSIQDILSKGSKLEDDVPVGDLPLDLDLIEARIWHVWGSPISHAATEVPWKTVNFVIVDSQGKQINQWNARFQDTTLMKVLVKFVLAHPDSRRLAYLEQNGKRLSNHMRVEELLDCAVTCCKASHGIRLTAQQCPTEILVNDGKSVRDKTSKI